MISSILVRTNRARFWLSLGSMGDILERKDALTATTMEIQLVKPRITAGQTSNYIVDWFEASTGREPCTSRNARDSSISRYGKEAPSGSVDSPLKCIFIDVGDAGTLQPNNRSPPSRPAPDIKNAGSKKCSIL